MTDAYRVTRVINELEQWAARRDAINVRRQAPNRDKLDSRPLHQAARLLREYREILDGELYPVTEPVSPPPPPAPDRPLPAERNRRLMDEPGFPAMMNICHVVGCTAPAPDITRVTLNYTRPPGDVRHELIAADVPVCRGHGDMLRSVSLLGLEVER